MADKSRPSTLTVYLYVPNMIGFVFDALDGWFARKLNQVWKMERCLKVFIYKMLIAGDGIGLIELDYSIRDNLPNITFYLTQFQHSELFLTWLLTVSTACLLVILSQVYRPGFIFLSLLALDIASHWLQMYSSFLVGKTSHKDVKDSTSWLFRLYYGNRKFMGYCCVSCEVLYIVLFLLAKNQTENITDVLVNAATQSWLYFTLLSLILVGWGIKQLINVIQIKTAADACIHYDIDKRR
ncbi:hypothetical protein OROGR_020085 [Orobanche gracilis]